MSMTYDDLKTDIDIVAHNVARDYPDIDWQDLRQELSVFVLKNGKSLKPRQEGGNPRRILNLVANKYAKDLRTQHMILSPQYAYTPNDIKLILETAYDASSLSGAYVPDDARSPLSKTFTVFDEEGGFKTKDIDPFHFADAMEVASDVKAAAAKLKPEHREAIFERYVLGKVPENSSWERKRLNNAINELTLKLNWYRGGVGGDRRRVTSNAGAKVRITEDYE